MNKIRRLRSIAHTCQGGRCYYCGAPTWVDDQKEFTAKYRLTQAETWCLQATAEHLRARCEGGNESRANIACACMTCNSRRHRRKKSLAPDPYGRWVRKRVEKGAWHSPGILRLIPAPDRSHL